MNRIVSLIAAALLASGCSRDTALPGEKAAPEITAIDPSSAFAGEVVEIAGLRFDGELDANLVVFPRASVRPFGRTAGGLLVRVPRDAGTGPVTVSAPGGTSGPSSPFTYRGLGELRGYAVGAIHDLLVRPSAIHFVNGFPVYESISLGALAWIPDGRAPWGGSSISRPKGYQRAASKGDGFHVLSSQGRLRTYDFLGNRQCDEPVDWDPSARVARVAAVPALGDLVGVFTPVASGWSVTVFEEDVPCFGGWAPLQDGAPLEVGGEEVRIDSELLDDGAGALLALGRVGAGAPQLLRIQLDTAPPGVVPLSGFARSPTGGFAVGTVGITRVAVVALDDGGLAVHDAASGTLLTTVQTRFTSPIGQVAITGGGTVVAASYWEDLVVGVPFISPWNLMRVRWGRQVSRPSVLGGDADAVWVGSDVANELLVLEEGSGGVVAVRGLDPTPTGLAYLPDSDAGWSGADVVGVATTTPAAHYEWGIGLGAGGRVLELPNGSVFRPARIAANPQADSFWLASAEGFGNGLTTTWLTGVDALPAAANDLALSGTSLVVPHAAGISVLDAGGFHLGHPATYGSFVTPAVGPDGRVLVAVRDGGVNRAQIWTPAALVADGAPDLDLLLPGDPTASVWIDGEPWVFYGAVNGSSHGARLTPAGLVDAVGVTVPPRLVPSPNGRTFAAVSLSYDAVWIYAADPAAGFPILAGIPVEGVPIQVAFDETGERLFVLTRLPARILQVQ